MIRFRHIGCESETVRYVGDAILGTCARMVSKDWRWPDGSRVAVMASRFVRCPDCGRAVLIHAAQVMPIDDDHVLLPPTEAAGKAFTQTSRGQHNV